VLGLDLPQMLNGNMFGDLMRYLGKDGKVRLRVYWPDDWHELVLDEADWRTIAEGKKFSEAGGEYCYDGKDYVANWVLNASHPGSLLVTYQSLADDEGSEGEGFIGEIEDAIPKEEE